MGFVGVGSEDGRHADRGGPPIPDYEELPEARREELDEATAAPPSGLFGDDTDGGSAMAWATEA